MRPAAAQSVFSLEGKLALITGGGTGIGLEIARCMTAAGATVVITGRREAVLQDAVDSLGESAQYLANDISELIVHRRPGGAD